MEHIQRIGGPDEVVMKMHELKRKYELLEARKEDIEKELDYEIKRSCHKRPRKEVENWIANVRRAKPQVEELERRVLGSGSFSRIFLKGKVDTLVREVHELREESNFERGLTLETYDNHGVAFLTRRLIGEAFKKNKKMIFDRLLGGEDSIVGVYGMGGVGKTTLVTHIHNELLRRPNTNVSWVTVSQNSSTQKLQDDIAKTVRLDISDEDDVRKRAAILANALEKKDNLILILDDVWDYISLVDVGICIGENVRKLVLTTRSLTVCQRLNCERPIKVEPLLEGESWMLFGETLNKDALLSDHRINGIAKSLVRECDGLPLGIVVMAGSMRGVDDVREWSNALREIKEAKYGSNDDMGFHDRVFLVLKYSYDRLKDRRLQECLLYCCLFPEDSKIDRDDLIEYLIDEKLIDGSNGRQVAFEKGHTILNNLERVCLLEAREGVRRRRCVQLHDLVRDMAIKITSDRFLVRAGMQLIDFPCEEEWTEDLMRVSLAYNKIPLIPWNTSPNCPNLVTFLLRDNLSLTTLIPENIFSRMKKLTVVDLSRTEIQGLPKSMANLTSLTALLLGGCKSLKCVLSLENLTALRRLDLSETSIDEVPKGLEKLINLRHLSVKGCKAIKTIPEGMLPQLFQLELFKSSIPLTLRGGEVGQLKKLEIFHGNFSDMSELNTCLGAWGERRPKDYAISVGRTNSRMPLLDYSRQVRVVNIGEPEATFALFSDNLSLRLENCIGVTSLSHSTKSAGLIRCVIRSCSSVRHVICSCCSNVPISQSLKYLCLYRLPKLTDIVERDTRSSHSTTFSSLKALEIYFCDGLERLCTPSTLSSLNCLEELRVMNCMKLVKIVGDDEEMTAVTFPNLRLLKLHNLPKLQRLCHSNLKLSDSLKILEITICPELKRITLLWDEPHPPPSLKKIVVERNWWDSVDWQNRQTKDVLRPFVKFCR